MIRRFSHPLRAWMLALVALVLWPLAAGAQLQTGNIFGTVVDNQGAALPGVTVTLAGIGAPQVQVTSAQGQFRFLGLSPGSYSIQAELEGFSTVDFPSVSVNVGRNTTLEITLSAAVEDVITVTGETPLLDERRVGQGATVSSDDLARVPTARDPWSLLSQAPGVIVDRVNVGGNESGQQSNFVGMGANPRDNVFAVDGVVLTDMNAVGASATYFDFGAFEEVQFTVTSADVTAATSGVTINQVTKRGTNNWRGAARYLRTDGSWQSAPKEIAPGQAGNEIDSVEEYGADLGGPIVKDRLWFWVSYGESDIRNLAGGSGQLDQTQLEDFNSKLNFQLTDSNSGVLHYWTNDKLKFGRGAGPTRAPETTLDQTTPQDIYKIEDTWIANSSLLLTALWGRDDGIFTLTPQGGLDANIFRDADGVLRGSNFSFAQEAVIDQGRVEGNYHIQAGDTGHELKFGAGFREQENSSGTVWPRGKSVVSGELLGLDPGIAQVIFPRNRTFAVKSTYDSAWLQDTITAGRWTFNVGLRYDKQEVENLPSSDPGNPQAQGLIPALNFAGNDAGGFSWDSIVPRIGVTYALGEERRTLLRGSFSRYAEQLGQLPLASRVNPIAYSYAYFYFADSNGNLVLDPNETGSLQFAYTYNIDPDNPSSLVTPNVNDPNLDPSMTDEITFGIEHGLSKNSALGFTLTWRNISDIAEQRLIVVDASGATRLATRADWEQVSTVTATLPDGSRVTVPAYDLKDGISSTGGALYTNGDREQDYLGLTANYNRRLAEGWSFRAYAHWNDWDWKIGDDFRLYDDPNDVVTDGLGFSDSEDVAAFQSGGNKADVFTSSGWSFGLYSLYQVAPEKAWGFNVAASINGREGFISPPFRNFSTGDGRRRLQFAPLDEFRNDDLITFDMRVEKDFKVGDLTIVLGLDGFNLTNESYVLQVERNVLAGRFDDTNEILSPRVFRLGATFKFR